MQAGVDEQAAQGNGEQADQASLGSKGPAGGPQRPALLDGDQGWAGIRAADREAVDVALEEVPGDVDANRHGQLPTEHEGQAQEQPGQHHVDRADRGGIGVGGMQEAEKDGGEQVGGDQRGARRDARAVEAFRQVAEQVAARGELFLDTDSR